MSKTPPQPVALRGWRMDTRHQRTAELTFTADENGRVRVAVSEADNRTREYLLPAEIRDLAALLRWAERHRP